MLPFFHIYGLVVIMHAALYRGATIVTMPRFDLRDFLRDLQEYGITRAYVVPPIVLALSKHPLVDEFDLSSLELLACGAAPLSADVEVACATRLGCRMRQGYGLTEASPVTHAVPDDLAGQMPGAIGLPVANTECRIVDVATGEDVPAGELFVRGPQMMKGYLNNSQATALTIDAQGWLHTGDVARVDEDGAFRIVDRVKELIKYKGYQLAPAELEALLFTHSAISYAAVIPLPRRGGRGGPEGVRRPERVAHARGGDRRVGRAGGAVLRVAEGDLPGAARAGGRVDAGGEVQWPNLGAKGLPRGPRR